MATFFLYSSRRVSADVLLSTESCSNCVRKSPIRSSNLANSEEFFRAAIEMETFFGDLGTDTIGLAPFLTILGVTDFLVGLDMRFGMMARSSDVFTFWLF